MNNQSIYSKLIELEKTLTISILIKKTNSFEIKQKIDTILLDFCHEIFFQIIGEIYPSKETIKLTLKIFSNLQTFFRPLFREKIACDIFSMLLAFDKINFQDLHNYTECENLLRHNNPDLTLDELKGFILHTKESILEKSSATVYNNFSFDQIHDNVLNLRKVYKFYLKVFLVIFFGNDTEFSVDIEEVLIREMLEFFCKLFEENNANFANIISKEFSDLLYSRKTYSSRNLSTNKVTSFLRNLIFNPKYKELDLLNKIVRTFISYEDYKSEFSAQKNKRRKNIFNFLHVFIERIFSPFNYNFKETFYDPDRFAQVKSRILDSDLKITSITINEFYDKLKEIFNCEKKLLNTINKKANNFKILRDLEAYHFISITKKTFDYDIKIYVKKFNFIKYLACTTKIEIVTQLFKCMNFDNCKYSVITLLFHIYKKIYKEFDTDEIHCTDRNKDLMEGDSEDINFISLFQIKNILENPRNFKKLQQMLTLNKFEVRDLFSITMKILSEINEEKENFCFTRLLPSFENISGAISIPFLNFLMLLNKNKKILNKHSTDEINTIFYAIFSSLPKLYSQNFDKHTLIIVYSFILNAFASEQFNQTDIFKSFPSDNLKDFLEGVNTSQNSLFDDYDYDSENRKIFIMNYIFNQIHTEDSEMLVGHTTYLVATSVSDFSQSVEIMNDSNYKQYTNTLHTNLNFIKCILATRLTTSHEHIKTSYYDLYCRNQNCQKKIKKEKILILNKFLYSCNWCGYYHLILNYEDGLDNNRNIKIHYEGIIQYLKEVYFGSVLDFNKFYQQHNNNEHNYFRTFYAYLNFLHENWKHFNFSYEERADVARMLAQWDLNLNLITYESFYQHRILTSKFIKQTQKNVDSIKFLIYEITLND